MYLLFTMFRSVIQRVMEAQLTMSLLILLPLLLLLMVTILYFPHRYKAVIDACSLQPDIDLLPFGDQTEIGERVGGACWRAGWLPPCGDDVTLHLLLLLLFLLPLNSGHQPQRRAAAEDLRGPSALPAHQHRLSGELQGGNLKFFSH